MVRKMLLIQTFMMFIRAHSEFITPFWLYLATIPDIKKWSSTFTQGSFPDILDGQCCESFQS